MFQVLELLELLLAFAFQLCDPWCLGAAGSVSEEACQGKC